MPYNRYHTLIGDIHCFICDACGKKMFGNDPVAHFKATSSEPELFLCLNCLEDVRLEKENIRREGGTCP